MVSYDGALVDGVILYRQMDMVPGGWSVVISGGCGPELRIQARSIPLRWPHYLSLTF